jgi:hypothetical protein
MTLIASPAAASPVQAQGASGEVTTYHLNKDGSGYGAIYAPAVGVTADQLFAQLKAAGVADLVDPQKAAVTALDPQQCYHNTAYAYKDGICPPKTWTYQGHARPIVYFKDYTGNGWPVTTAVSTWNESLAIDSHWLSYTSACPSNVHCVPVNEHWQASGVKWCGLTSFAWDSANHFIDGRVTIEFNNTNFDNGKCQATHLSTVCHELGHALGLSHNLSKGSCLYSTSVFNLAQLPSADDYWVLEFISY